MDNRYQRGKIYKIVSDQTEQIYIGSTTEPTLACRMRGHRDALKKFTDGKRARITSFDILQHPDAQIVLIENFPCQSKDELHARERFHIENTVGCVNKQIPGRTKAEYRQTNKDVILAKKREYYQANKDDLADQMHDYYEANKETIGAKMKEQYQAKREALCQPNVCPCGGKFTTVHKHIHEKTKKHQQYVAGLA